MPTVHVFVSYAHEDSRWVQEGSLIPALEASLRRDEVTFWHDPKLIGGDEYQRVIEDQIARADIVILLVSQYFLDSDFITDVELPRIEARAVADRAMVLPMLVAPCTWEENRMLSKRTMLPAKLAPLIDFDGQPALYEKARDMILRTLKCQVKTIHAERERRDRRKEDERTRQENHSTANAVLLESGVTADSDVSCPPAATAPAKTQGIGGPEEVSRHEKIPAGWPSSTCLPTRIHDDTPRCSKGAVALTGLGR